MCIPVAVLVVSDTVIVLVLSHGGHGLTLTVIHVTGVEAVSVSVTVSVTMSVTMSVAVADIRAAVTVGVQLVGKTVVVLVKAHLFHGVSGGVSLNYSGAWEGKIEIEK